MEFSVIVPTYNCGKVIEATLRSIRQNSFADYELIVVDDCSTDDTATVAAQYADFLLVLQSHRGPAFARNCAAQKANADYLVWSDSDVLWPPELLQRFHDAIAANPGCGGVATGTSPRPINDGFLAEYYALQERFTFNEYIKGRALSDYQYVTTRCGAMRRDLFLELGGFDERYLVPSIEDFEFSLRFMRKARFVCIPDSGVRHYWPESLAQMAKRLFRNSFLWTKTLFRDGRFDNALTTCERAVANVVGVVSLLTLLLVLLDFRLLLLPVMLAGVTLFLNRRIFGFLSQARGGWFAIRAAMLLQLMSAIILVGAACGLLTRNRSGKWYVYEKPNSP